MATLSEVLGKRQYDLRPIDLLHYTGLNDTALSHIRNNVGTSIEDNWMITNYLGVTEDDLPEGLAEPFVIEKVTLSADFTVTIEYLTKYKLRGVLHICRADVATTRIMKSQVKIFLCELFLSHGYSKREAMDNSSQLVRAIDKEFMEI